MTWPQHQRRQCEYEGCIVRFSKLEHRILTTLLLNRGRTIAHSDLIAMVYPDPDMEPDWAHTSVHATVCRLRAKLPGAIHTEWGKGFYIPIAIVA